MIEYTCADHGHSGARPCGGGDCADMNSPVDFDIHMWQFSLAQHMPHPRDRMETLRNKLRTAEARIDRHDEHEIDVGEDFFNRHQRSSRIDRDTDLCAQFANLLQRAM